MNVNRESCWQHLWVSGNLGWIPRIRIFNSTYRQRQRLLLGAGTMTHEPLSIQRDMTLLAELGNTWEKGG